MNLQSELGQELWMAVAEAFEAELYKNAILEAIHFLSNVLRERAGVDGDGVSLVGQALGGDAPRLRINPFQTESERSEQKGFEQILRGLYQGIRNPRSHEQRIDTRQHAESIILFVNFSIEVINSARKPQSLNEWLTSVFDPDYVNSDRYVSLLIEELPSGKRFDALVAIYRAKTREGGYKLDIAVRQLADAIDEEKLTQFLAIVSDELRTTTDDEIIGATFQVFPPQLWPRLNESARIRVENKVVKSIREGVDVEHQKGWLATWATNFFKYFGLRYEVLQALHNKITGPRGEQEYFATYFMNSLPDLVVPENDELAKYHRGIFMQAISNAVSDYTNTTVRELVARRSGWPRPWNEQLIKALEHLKANDPEYYESVVEADEIPF